MGKVVFNIERERLTVMEGLMSHICSSATSSKVAWFARAKAEVHIADPPCYNRTDLLKFRLLPA